MYTLLSWTCLLIKLWYQVSICPKTKKIPSFRWKFQKYSCKILIQKNNVFLQNFNKVWVSYIMYNVINSFSVSSFNLNLSISLSLIISITFNFFNLNVIKENHRSSSFFRRWACNGCNVIDCMNELNVVMIYKSDKQANKQE